MGKLRCRRILAAALCAALLLSGQALAASYGDMSGHWAEAAVDRWSTLGIVQGDDQGNFRPDDTISRAELAAILNRYMKYTEQAENTYADLPEDAWYTEDILCLAEAGLMLGDGEYQRPNDPSPARRRRCCLPGPSVSRKGAAASPIPTAPPLPPGPEAMSPP